MTYQSIEESVASGLPVEAYEFVGTYTTYRYTNADRPISFFGQTYQPSPIKREEAVSGDQSQDGVEMVIEIPQTEDIVRDYVFGISPPDLNLTVYRCHLGLDFTVDPVIFWKGPVTGFNLDTDICKIRIPSILENVFSGNMPNFFYQQSCNNTLFDNRCGLIKSSFTITASVLSMSGNQITVDDDGYADSFLKSGIIAIPSFNEKRLILDNISNVITVVLPFSNLVVSDTVELSVGCDHSFATCKSKFSNGRRFGGFPYIPKDNPFQGNI
jgi:uncharacterized phage protein (TIGR02218 family)